MNISTGGNLTIQEAHKQNIDKFIINDLVYEKSNDTQPTQGSKGVKKTIIISSSDRYDFKDSKFKYKVKNIQQLLKIIKLIIPIENSIHFTTPILKLKIKELNIDTQLYLSETYLLNNYR